MGQRQTPIDHRRARSILRLRGPIEAASLRAAFNSAVKAAHPDRPGGDPERLRDVVAAHALLKAELPTVASAEAPPIVQASAPEPPPSEPEAEPHPIPPIPARPQTLTITPALAAAGGEVEAVLADARRLKIQLPPGLRPGDHLRAGDTLLTIAVTRDPDLVLRGDDLWMTRDLPGDAPNGGRLGVETPTGLHQVWVDRQALARGLVRLNGRGLPARGPHAAGDLFVRLRPAAHADSGARSRLRAFEQAWAT
jgi:curved DNA-binding protein